MNFSVKKSIRPAVISAFVALLSFVLLHLRGMPIDPDGWAFWQGAASLADGHGYSYFSGNSILHWPPLYSTYLAAWIVLLGPSGWSLLLSNGLLIVLQAFLYVRLAEIIADDTDLGPSNSAQLLLAVCIGLFVALHEQPLFSQNLLYTLFPAYLFALWKVCFAFGTPREKRWMPAVLIVLGCLLCVSHTSALCFVAAAALTVGTYGGAGRRSLLLAALVFAVPAAAWLGIRFSLGQGGSHSIAPGTLIDSIASRALELFGGVGLLLAPPRLGASWLALLCLLLIIGFLSRSRGAKGLRFVALFTLYATAATIGLYSLTTVAALSAERYVLFVVLTLLPLAYLTGAHRRERVAAALIILMLAPQAYWAGLYVTQRHTSGGQASVRFPTDLLVPARAYISRLYRDGAPMETASGLLISPIKFEEPRQTPP